MKTFEDRVAVVTGAASGIGRALSERFAAERMRVVMADVDAERLEESVSALAESGAAVIGVPTDVGSAEAVDELAARAVERFGAVHVLCNNAGVSTPGRAWEIGLDDWDWILRVNLWSVIHGIRSFVPRMIERGEPAHIVNTASIAGLLGFSIAPPYIGTKFAVVGLSEVLRHQLTDAGVPIGVSVLCPGTVKTNLGVNSNRFRPSGTTSARTPDATEAPISPDEVAAIVLQAIRDDRFWILTHPEYRELVVQRARAIATDGELVLPPII